MLMMLVRDASVHATVEFWYEKGQHFFALLLSGQLRFILAIKKRRSLCLQSEEGHCPLPVLSSSGGTDSSRW